MMTAAGARRALRGGRERLFNPCSSEVICGQKIGKHSSADSENVGRHPKVAAMHAAPAAR